MKKLRPLLICTALLSLSSIKYFNEDKSQPNSVTAPKIERLAIDLKKTDGELKSVDNALIELKNAIDELQHMQNHDIDAVIVMFYAKQAELLKTLEKTVAGWLKNNKDSKRFENWVVGEGMNNFVALGRQQSEIQKAFAVISQVPGNDKITRDLELNQAEIQEALSRLEDNVPKINMGEIFSKEVISTLHDLIAISKRLK